MEVDGATPNADAQQEQRRRARGKRVVGDSSGDGDGDDDDASYLLLERGSSRPKRQAAREADDRNLGLALQHREQDLDDGVEVQGRARVEQGGDWRMQLVDYGGSTDDEDAKQAQQQARV